MGRPLTFYPLLPSSLLITSQIGMNEGKDTIGNENALRKPKNMVIVFFNRLIAM